jgi:hypothetical protein
MNPNLIELARLTGDPTLEEYKNIPNREFSTLSYEDIAVKIEGFRVQYPYCALYHRDGNCFQNLDLYQYLDPSYNKSSYYSFYANIFDYKGHGKEARMNLLVFKGKKGEPKLNPVVKKMKWGRFDIADYIRDRMDVLFEIFWI